MAQKWLIPYRRYKLNYEDVGYLPLVLQHDIGFSREKTYHIVRQGGYGQFFIVPDSGVFYRRSEALARIRELAKSGRTSNPIPSRWTDARVMRTRSGQVKVMLLVKRKRKTALHRRPLSKHGRKHRRR